MAYNKKEQLENNIEAIRTALELEVTRQIPDAKHLEALKKYSGFGGLKFILQPADTDSDIEKWSNQSEKQYFPMVQKLHELVKGAPRRVKRLENKDLEGSLRGSVLTSFYTPKPVVDAIASSIGSLHLQDSGRVRLLDPSSGIGAFGEAFHSITDERTYLEKDHLTALILDKINARDRQTGVYNIPFEELRVTEDSDKYDIVTSNIPFGDISVFDADFARSSDKDKKESSRKIHTYFFAKALDVVRPGGLVAFITSRGLLDSSSNEATRRYLMNNSHLISAIRLPDGLFSENAGTEVGSDLIILQKAESEKISLTEQEALFIQTSKDNENGITENALFSEKNGGLERLVGFPYKSIGKDGYGKPTYVYNFDGDLEKLSDSLNKQLVRDLSKNYRESLYQRHAVQTIIPTHSNSTPNESQPANTQSIDKPITLLSSTNSKGKKRGKKNGNWEQHVEGNNKIYTNTNTGERIVQKGLFDFGKSGAVADNTSRESVDNSKLPRPYGGEIYTHFKDKNGVLIKDGTQIGHLSYSQLSGAIFTPLELSLQQIELLDIYIKIRDNYQRLLYKEESTQTEAKELREDLNTNYDLFKERYGYLNKSTNKDLIQKYDSISTQVFSLERPIKEQKDEYLKSDIFDHPVAFAITAKGEITNATEALASSLNKYGAVDMGYIEGLLPKQTTDEILKELKGRVFYNPLSNKYELKEQFVSGHVIKKAEQIEKWMAENPNEAHFGEEGLIALREATPAPIPYSDIDFSLGERWVSDEIYSRFASDVLGVPIKVTYNKALDNYDVAYSNSFFANKYFRNVEINETYCVKGATRNHDGIKMMTHALRDTLPEMTQKIMVEDKFTGELVPKSVPDSQGLQMANNIKEKLRNEYKHWIDRQSLEFKQALAETYNRLYNGRVVVKFDGSHQTFPNLDFSQFDYSSLYQSQKDAIWMLKVNGGGIVDHEVGGGKTMIMIAAAYEMKRLGLVNKPIILCKKANYDAIAKTAKEAYPNARILAPNKKEMGPQERDTVFNDIVNNDWDMIIMTHDNFEKIPQSLEMEAQIVRDELNDAEQNLAESLKLRDIVSKVSLKGLEKKKINLMNRLNTIQQSINDRADDAVDFKLMGIDHIFIDESHVFKNLSYNTRHTRVAGLSNTDGANRALNLLTAIRTIQARTGKDLGATFVSGTTITNSLTELYLLFKYLRPRALEEQGIRSFDAWAAVFANKTAEYEFSVTNQIKLKERFRTFKNAPELGAFYKEITDFRTAEDINLERPEANVELYNIPQTPAQEAFLDKLVQFAETGDATLIGRDKLTESEDQARMLLVTNYAAKMSLDMRLIDPTIEDHIDSKASHCAKKVADYYYKFNEQKGTQFIFSDLATWKSNTSEEFDIYRELKRKLVEDYEIPESQIRFAQEFKTDKQKEAMCKDLNDGNIRVIIGSTETLGTGVNAQKRAVAIHHLDTPWVPSAIEQRNGRAVRKGNWVAKEFNGNKVDIYLYAVENTLDAYKFNLLQNKQQFITQLKKNTSNRTLDEGNMDANNGMNYAEFVAVVSGNTALLDKVKIERKISHLESLQNAFRKERYAAQEKYNGVKESLEKAMARLESARADEKAFNSKLKLNDKKEVINNIVLYEIPNETDIEKQAKYLHKLVDTERTNNSYKRIGEVYGFPIMIKSESSNKEGMFTFTDNRFFVKGEGGVLYSYNNGHLASDPKLATENFVNALKKIPSVIENLERTIEKHKSELKEYDQILAIDKFDKADELEALKSELHELNQEIERTLKGNKKATNNQVSDESSEVVIESKQEEKIKPYITPSEAKEVERLNPLDNNHLVIGTCGFKPRR